MKPTTSLHLDTRRSKNNDKYPLKVRVTYLRQRKYYKTGIDLTIKEWERINAPKPRGEFKSMRDRAGNELKKAEAVIENMEVFTFSAFEKMLFRSTGQNLDLSTAFQASYNALQDQKRVNTAEAYNNSIKSLLAFKRNLLMTDITPEFLHKYEGWMLQNGKSLTTVGIYLRNVRSVLNAAIEEGVLKREQYPFGKRKYQIPSGQNIKKSLTKEEVAALYYHEIPAFPSKERARDFWLFSYLANGMNFKDICQLKFSNIVNDTLVFFRAKTVRTRRGKPTPIVAMITDDIRRIIDKWGSKEKLHGDYIFPILSSGITPQQERDIIKQFIKTTNKWLQKVADEAGIHKKVTTYSARHSFSTILKNEGASIQYIKESLGHNSTLTTENYLNTFPDDMKRKFSKQLTAFKRP